MVQQTATPNYKVLHRCLGCLAHWVHWSGYPNEWYAVLWCCPPPPCCSENNWNMLH